MSIVSSLINAELPSMNYGVLTVQDTMFCSALSDASGMPDFKYVFDVYANGNQLTRVKLYPDPITAYGYFDAGPSVRNEMDYGWVTVSMFDGNYKQLSILEPNQTNQIAINYDIRFGEEYISGGAYVSGNYVSGGTLVTLLNEASGTHKAYNYAASLFNRKSYNINQFDNKFLTNRPKKAKCRLDGDLLIPFKIPYGSTTVFGFKVSAYYENGNQQFTFNTFDDYVSYVIAINEFYQANIGPSYINDLILTAGKTSIINNNTSYYDVWFQDMDSGDLITEPFRVYLDCNPRYESIDLFFMNQWGMLDTARFDLSSRLNMDIERKSFTKKDYEYLTIRVNYGPKYETKINYGSKLNWTYKLTMNYPTDEEYVWLAELISSPIIYANFPEITDGEPMPVTIKNTNYEYSKNQNNGLKTLEIEVELNQVRRGFLR